MPPRTLTWTMLLAVLVAACSDGESSTPVVPAFDAGPGGGTVGGGGSGVGGSTGGQAGAGGLGGSTPSAPLTVHPDNPRYFADATGRAVRLGGHQIFSDLQDDCFNHPQTYDYAETLDWSWYLDFAGERNLNFVRNWIIWSSGSGSSAAPDRIATPMMYERTGPGTAADGLPKFDLTRFNQAFFDRMHDRIAEAAVRGITVSVMLFEVYGFGPGEEVDGQTLWHGNVLRGENNVQGIDVNSDSNGWGTEFFYTTDPTLLDLQKAFVTKVVETVGDLDNVMFEIANELYAPDWQAEIVAHIRSLEAGQPKQHIIYRSPGGRTASGSWTPTPKDVILESGADAFGIDTSMGAYDTDPPVDESGMPAIWDNDHVWGDEWEHHRRAWWALTTGYHFVFYDHPFEQPDTETPAFETMRCNIGATNAYAARFADLARMDPHGELSSTGYCLADPGQEYLVYQPGSGGFTLELDAGTYDLEWFDPSACSVDSTDTVTSEGGTTSLQPPASVVDDSVAYLRRAP